MVLKNNDNVQNFVVIAPLQKHKFPGSSSGPWSAPHSSHFGHSSSKTLSNAASTASSHSALVAASIVRYNAGGLLIDDYTVAKELCQLGYQDDSSRFIR